jgi:hypothetical protein
VFFLGFSILSILIFWVFNILCSLVFLSVELVTSFNYSYLNFIVGVCNEFNDD